MVEFRNIHFRYPTRPDVPILQGINLTLQPGKTLALVRRAGNPHRARAKTAADPVERAGDVGARAQNMQVGPSGCGKSTTVSLLQRFYDPEQGQVLVDGVDVRDVRVRVCARRAGCATTYTQ